MQKGEETFGLRPQIIFICLTKSVRARIGPHGAPHACAHGSPPCAQPGRASQGRPRLVARRQQRCWAVPRVGELLSVEQLSSISRSRRC